MALKFCFSFIVKNLKKEEIVSQPPLLHIKNLILKKLTQ